MTTLLKIIHGIVTMAVGISFVGTFIVAIVLFAQYTGALAMDFVTLHDLVIMVSVLLASSLYLRYTGSPETLASYIKHKLGLEDKEQ